MKENNGLKQILKSKTNYKKIYDPDLGATIPYFDEEPLVDCPRCGKTCHAEFVDNGFGPYAVQAGPYHCAGCNWVEDCPCEKCLMDRCNSYDICRKAK